MSQQQESAITPMPKKRWTDSRTVGRPMKGRDLRDWRRAAAQAFPHLANEDGVLPERDAAEILGMSRGALRNCELNGAPLYIALACSALLVGLKPYTRAGR